MIDYTQSTYEHIRPDLDEIDWDSVVAISRKHGEILLDSEDYERLSAGYRFRASPLGKSGYTRAQGEDKKTGKVTALGRLVLGYEGKDVVDHINKNPLDNRKINLRIATRALNNTHRRAKKDGREFHGVYDKSAETPYRPWMAARGFEGKLYWGISRTTPEQAALDWNWMTITAWGHAVELNDARCVSDAPQPRHHRCEGCHSVCYCCCVCDERKTPGMLRLADLCASRNVTQTAC